jgi:hypothetical protein
MNEKDIGRPAGGLRQNEFFSIVEDFGDLVGKIGSTRTNAIEVRMRNPDFDYENFSSGGLKIMNESVKGFDPKSYQDFAKGLRFYKEAGYNLEGFNLYRWDLEKLFGESNCRYLYIASADIRVRGIVNFSRDDMEGWINKIQNKYGGTKCDYGKSSIYEADLRFGY